QGHHLRECGGRDPALRWLAVRPPGGAGVPGPRGEEPPADQRRHGRRQGSRGRRRGAGRARRRGGAGPRHGLGRRRNPRRPGSAVAPAEGQALSPGGRGETLSGRSTPTAISQTYDARRATGSRSAASGTTSTSQLSSAITATTRPNEVNQSGSNLASLVVTDTPASSRPRAMTWSGPPMPKNSS